MRKSLIRRLPCRLLSSAQEEPQELKTLGKYFSAKLAENKESASAAASLSVVFVAGCGGVYFCGQIIGEFNRSSFSMAVMTIEHSKDKELLTAKLAAITRELAAITRELAITKENIDEKIKNETEQRVKDKEISDVKLGKKGYLW